MRTLYYFTNIAEEVYSLNKLLFQKGQNQIKVLAFF